MCRDKLYAATAECNPQQMRRTLFFLLFLFSLSLFAQNGEPLRVELVTEKDYHDYNYEICGRNGAIVFYKSNLLNKDTANWVILQYDTNLTQTRNTEIHIPNLAEPISSYYTDNFVHILFQKDDNRNKSSVWFLLTYQCDSVNTKLLPLALTLNEISYIKAYDDYLYCVANEKKTIGANVVHLPTMEVKGIYLEDYYIEQYAFLEIDTLNERLLIGALHFPKVHEALSTFALIDSDLGFNEYALKQYPESDGIWLTGARCAVSDSGDVLLVGTYNHNTEKRLSNLHTGVYALPYRNGKMGEIHYYNYSNLKSSNSPSQEKIQNLNLELILGNVFHNNNQFALVTEVYYPEYNYNNTYASSFGYYYGYGGYPTTTFAGYHFTHSYITTFDKEGKLVWDNYFPFNNVITNTLYTKTSVYIDKENLGYIYYNFGNKITSTLVDKYEVIEPVTSQVIVTKYPSDEVEYTRNLQIRNWYDNNFIICGYQYIKNGSRSKSGKRFVFTMNKLIYE